MGTVAHGLIEKGACKGYGLHSRAVVSQCVVLLLYVCI